MRGVIFIMPPQYIISVSMYRTLHKQLLLRMRRIFHLPPLFVQDLFHDKSFILSIRPHQLGLFPDGELVFLPDFDIRTSVNLSDVLDTAQVSTGFLIGVAVVDLRVRARLFEEKTCRNNGECNQRFEKINS